MSTCRVIDRTIGPSFFTVAVTDSLLSVNDFEPFFLSTIDVAPVSGSISM